MKYHSDTIGQLLSRLNKDIFIPGIQRPFVWERERIIKLFDSLMRGYPINAFMLWELQPEHHVNIDIYNFIHRFRQTDIHNESVIPPADRPVTLVLDGQQRLTSLLIGLAGSYRTRLKGANKANASSWIEETLYLDLLLTPTDSENIDSDDAAVREIYYGFKFGSTEKPPKSSAQHVWFSVSDIMRLTTPDQRDARIDKELDKHENLSTDNRRSIERNLKRLHEVVWKDDSITYYLERDPSYEKVLDIFIRVNDGGKALSKSELLMGIVTLHWDTHARKVTEQLTYHLREILQQETKFDREFLLRAGLFFNDLDFLFKISNFTPKNISIIETKWPATDHALRFGAEILRRAGITGGHLTGHNALMLVACYIYKLNQGLPPERWEILPSDTECVRRWIISVLFHNVLGGTANITMDLFRRVLDMHLKDEASFPAQALVDKMTKRNRVMRYDEPAIERFVALEAKGRLGQPCLSLLYDRNDWSSESWVMVAVVPSHRLIDDRLLNVGVPESDVRVSQSWSGKIANHILLTQAESREYHQLDFEDWLSSRSDAWLTEHLLPTDFALYHERCFLDFIKARTALITQRLTTLFDSPEVAAQTAVTS